MTRKPLPAYVTLPDGRTEWNPDLVADHSDRIGLHEAAHAAANYLFGRETHSAQTGERKGRTLVPKTDDVFADAVCSLAGEAFERSIGLEFSGGRSDLERAEKLLSTQCSGAALDEACRVVEEAALELVSSERFQTLAFALGPVIAKERYVGAAEIRRILEAADPERPSGTSHAAVRESHSRQHMAPVSTVSYEDGSVTLYSNGKLLLSRASRAEVDRMAEEILKGVWKEVW